MPSAANARAYVNITRPQNASGSVITYFIGFFLATNSISIDFFIGLLILLALHSLATIQNDVEDFEIDQANKRSSILQSRSISLADARFFIFALVFAALIFAFISPHKKLNLIAIAGLMAIAWVYNLQPFRASKRPVMSISIMGICYGVLPFVYGYLLGDGDYRQWYFLALLPFWFLARFSTAILKDYKDAAGDKKFQKDTFYLHFGSILTAWTSIVAALVSYFGIIMILTLTLNKNTMFYIFMALAALLAIKALLLRFSLLETTNEKTLNSIFHKTVFRHNQFEGALLLCLILSSR